MRDSKLVEMLGMFSKGEMKSFEKFVISPYFTAGRSVEGLFNILKNTILNSTPLISREKRSSRNSFPGKNTTRKNLRI